MGVEDLQGCWSTNVVGQLYSVQCKGIFGMPDKGQMLYV
jgi:hypothetical protein